MSNNIKSTSITTPITSDTLQANVTPTPFTQMDKVLANTNIQEINGLISREIIKEYFENQYTNGKEKLHLKTLDDDKILSINFWQYANELYGIFKKYENGDIKAKAAIENIDGHIKKIVDILKQFKSRYEDTFQNTKLDNIEIKTTQDLFAKGKEQIEELLNDIEKAKNDAQMLAKNQTYKTIFKLAGLTFYCSHSSLVLSFANQYLRNRAILWMARICLGISPYLAVASLIVLALYSIYKLATKDDDLKISIFEFYCVLNAIMRQSYHYDGMINALVNFDKGVSGNIIAFGDDALRYFTSPLPYDIGKLIGGVRANFIDEAMLYKIPNVKNDNDIINNVFSSLEQNNLNTQNSKANNGELFAFSTFPNIAKDSILQDSDITNTSAFRHLKNITTQFSNFLLIQSPHFASGLMLDMLLQSFKTSPQNNQFIENKFALFITNPSEVNSMHYKIEKHIRSICNNDSLQHNTLFLNTINCVEKKAVFERFKQQISDNYKKLEAYYKNYYNKKHYIKHSIKEGWKKLFPYPDPAEALDALLQELCNNCSNKDILTIADNFSAISELVFKQEHLSDEDFYQEVPQAKEYYKNILETLLAFEKLFSYFVDFGIKQDDDNKINDKDLQELKDQVRAKLKNQDTGLSETAFYISNIINNAYFSNTPDNEIQYLKNLFKIHNDHYQRYKKNIEQYESYPEKQRFSNAIKTILPFHKEMLLDFFSEDEFDELCKFILYLIDLETGGAFLYYMHTSSILLEKVSKISKEDLKKIAKKSSNGSLQKLTEDKVMESMTNFIKNDFAAFLVGLVLKDVKENAKAKIKETLSNMKCDSEEMFNEVRNRIITNTNMTRLDALLGNIRDLSGLTQKFQEIQNIEIDNTININEINKNLTLSNAPMKIFHTISEILKSNKSTDWLIIFSLYDWLLEKIFPTISKEDVKRQITLFMLGIRTKKNQEYAKWEKGKPYFYIPKNLNKSLIIGDFMHSLLLDTPLNIGYCIHNPSIGAYTKNKNLAQNHFKDIIKSNLYPYDVRYFPQDQDSESSRIYKEAYIKVHSYIGNISYPLNPATKQENIPSFNVFINNEERIQTKLKYQKPQNDKQYQDKGESTNAQKDFIIQLKRVAEWSYEVYEGEEAVEINTQGWEQTKNNKLEASIVSNFIYNEHFVQTKIDIHKDL